MLRYAFLLIVALCRLGPNAVGFGAMVFGVAIAVGCDRRSPPRKPSADDRPEQSARSRQSPKQSPENAKETPEPPSHQIWTGAVQNVETSIQSFSSVKQCANQLSEKLPVELAEGLSDLGYAGFLHDVCVSLKAARDGDAALCDTLGVSRLRRSCQRRVAALKKEPGLCPDVGAGKGRDPLCLAWASRDERLCAAAASHEVPRCRAVLQGKAKLCRDARELDRRTCAALVARYAEAFDASPAPGEALPTTWVGDVVRQRPAARAERMSVHPAAVERGAYLASVNCQHRLRLGDEGVRSEAVVHLDIPVDTTRERPFEVPMGPGGAKIRVRFPDGAEFDEAGARGAITVQALEARRAGAVDVSIRGTLRSRSQTVRLRAQARTFVRDLEQHGTKCGSGG